VGGLRGRRVVALRVARIEVSGGAPAARGWAVAVGGGTYGRWARADGQPVRCWVRSDRDVGSCRGRLICAVVGETVRAETPHRVAMKTEAGRRS